MKWICGFFIIVVVFAMLGYAPMPWESCYYQASGREIVFGENKVIPRVAFPKCKIDDVSFYVDILSAGCYTEYHRPYTLEIRAERPTTNRCVVVIDKISARMEGDRCAFWAVEKLPVAFETGTCRGADAVESALMKHELPDMITPKDGKKLFVELSVSILDSSIAPSTPIRCVFNFVMMPKVDRGLIKWLGR